MRGRILVIEDDGDSREVYSVLLRHRGYDVVEAEDGETGLDLASRLQPCVIVMDIGLPGLDGYDIARQLRSDPRTRKIPLIAVTAHAFMEHEERAKEAGFDAFLRKPVEPMRVLTEVERWVDGR